MYRILRVAAAAAAATAIALPSVASAQQEYTVVSADSVEWGPAPDIMPEGAELAVLVGDPAEEGIYVMRVRLPDGTEVAPHWEDKVEYITVLEGTFHVGPGEEFDGAAATPLAAGDLLIMPEQVRHFAWAEGTTVLEVVGEGPAGEIFYVNPDDASSAGE